MTINNTSSIFHVPGNTRLNDKRGTPILSCVFPKFLDNEGRVRFNKNFRNLQRTLFCLIRFNSV